MKTILYWMAALVVLAFFTPHTNRQEASAESEDKTLSPYFMVQGDPATDQLPLKDTRVDMAISGVIADVAVTQVYKNEGSRPINARYVFPASTRAAVYGMRMIMGDQVIVARVKEREQAKQEFEKAKQEGKSASLLQQDRPNVFSMSVANILPGDEIQIELRYTELLVPTDGIYEVVYPTVVGPRYSSRPESAAHDEDLWVKSPYQHQDEAPRSQFHLAASISAAVPLQDVACPTHSASVHWKNPMLAQLTLNDSEAQGGNRDFILRYRLTGSQIASGLMLYRGEGENFFLLMAQPPARVNEEDIPVREYVFVVDVSGSMHGFPLNMSKNLLRDLIGHLRPSDLFNVVLFSGFSNRLSPTSLPATDANISRGISLIDSQSGAGGTELLTALQEAMSIPRQPGVSRSVILVTDGYIEAERNVFDYIRQNLDSSNVFSFGIGSSVNRYLIEGVAKAGQGEPFIVTEPAQAESVAARFREYVQSPVLTDIKVTWKGFDAYDVQPEKLPDLFAQRPIVLFGKWRGPLSGGFSISGKTGRGNYSAYLDVARVAPEDANRALRYLWARTRIAELSDFGSADPLPESVRQITSLGLTYNLLTRYTSFIAVREEVRNNQEPARDVHQPSPMPKGVSDLAIGGGGVTGEPEPDILYCIALLGILSLLTYIHRPKRRSAALRQQAPEAQK